MSAEYTATAQEAAPGENGAQHPEDPPVAGGEASKFVSFAVGDEQYCIDIMAVREIKGWSELTNLPNQPDFVRGVLNLRGVVVPIFDLRCRFGQGRTEATPLHVTIIVNVNDCLVGLLVDRVSDILSVDANTIQPAPDTGLGGKAGYLSGLLTSNEEMIAVLDLPRLIDDKPVEAAA